MKMPLIAATAALALVSVHTASGQVVRESDTGSVAGVVETNQKYDDFTFQSRGGEILFADIDSNVYQVHGGEAGHEVEQVCAEQGGGCSEEDRGGLCLQVLNQNDSVMCWAGKPAQPGWQTDPRLACPIDANGGGQQTYTLRIGRRTGESSCGPETTFATGPATLYLLNVSLRKTVDGGPLAPAVGQSRNPLH